MKSKTSGIVRLTLLLVGIGISIGCLSIQVWGQQVSTPLIEGYKALKKQKYSEALALFLPIDAKGEPDAELDLDIARCYAGLSQKTQALQYLSRSMDRGYYEYFDLVNDQLFEILHANPQWEIIKKKCLSNVTQQALSQDTQEELFLITLEDRSDRLGPNKKTLDAVVERDRIRREKVQQLLDQGKLRSAFDFRQAALIFHHGGTTPECEQALTLVSKAFALDPKNRRIRWLKAAIIDRYRLTLGLPQVYGTQYKMITSPIFLFGCFTVDTIDESLATDEDRNQMGVPKLADNYRQAATMHLTDMYK